MNTATIIGILVLVLVVGLASWYIYKEKKKGTTCIGCPYAGTCQKHKNGQGCEKNV